MKVDEIRDRLFELQDQGYHDFQSRLMPTVAPERFIGVRTPLLRKMAKELCQASKPAGGSDGDGCSDISVFLDDLPHKYFDENQLHIFMLSAMKDYDECIRRVDAFLPYIDNWATCDQLSPKVFKKHRAELLEAIGNWIDGRLAYGAVPAEADTTYIIRFGIGMLMEHFLDEDFKPEYIEMVASIRSEEYYVNMMIAWHLATALAKQWDATIPLLEGRYEADGAACLEAIVLGDWVHNKTIQKAIESNRISPEQKEYLRTLKR